MSTGMILGLILTHLSASASEATWDRFRGPNGSGVMSGARLPEVLDAEHGLIWKTAVGPGYSSPVLNEDAALVTTYEGTTLWAVCLDRFTGDELWRRQAPASKSGAYRGPNSPVSSTPATDGEVFYVLYPSVGLVAYDLEGEELWTHVIESLNVPHTMSTSPVLAGDRLLLQCDQDTGSFLLAVDRADGHEVWRSARPWATHGYSSPILHQPATGPAVVILSGSYSLDAYSVETGERRWWVEGMSWQGVTLPVLEGDRLHVHSFVADLSEFGAPPIQGSFDEALELRDANNDHKVSREEWPDEGMQQLWFLFDLDNDELLDEAEWATALDRGRSKGGVFGIRLDGEGDLSTDHVEWVYNNRRGMPDYASPLLLGGLLYLINDGGIFTALDSASGEVIKQERLAAGGSYYASPIAAAGRILVASQSGVLTVLEAGRDWRELGRVDLHEEIWATPALAADLLLVRTEAALYAFSTEEAH